MMQLEGIRNLLFTNNIKSPSNRKYSAKNNRIKMYCNTRARRPWYVPKENKVKNRRCDNNTKHLTCLRNEPRKHLFTPFEAT